HPSPTGGGRTRDGEPTRVTKEGLKQPASSPRVAPRHRKPLPAEEDPAARLVQVEAELQKARQDAATSAQTEILLRRKLAEALSLSGADSSEAQRLRGELSALKVEVGAREGADSEAQRLRGELSALKVEMGAREEREKEKAVVSARGLADQE
ncbi:unnamed protein product, partial [Laminaria digitata]